MENLWLLATATLILNLPFGFWRSGVRRYSLSWFLAVHACVPLVAALRISFGVGWQWKTFPALIAAYFAGQFLGGKLRLRWKRAD